MSRIDQTFRRLKDQGRKALIPFVVAGDPDLKTTQALVSEMAGRGADIIELGVPFPIPWQMGRRSKMAHSGLCKMEPL